ncbi:MAG: NAD-dependent epimerase/dehydratase family protein [Gemmatimonadaceae bacterium]
MLMQGARCLVTGGAGFIGSHLAARLVALGYRVRVVDSLSAGRQANLASIADDIEFVRGDLRSMDVCARATRAVDVIFHLAALPSVPRSLEDPWGSHDVNVNATVRLLQAARSTGVQRVVFSSSSSVYGDAPALPAVESTELLPRSPYAVSKLAGEQYVLAYSRAGLLEGVALRYFNVFGPHQDPDSPYAAVIPLMLRAALTRTPLTIFGDGEQTRDFTYVDNVVHANILAASCPGAIVAGHAVNVGTGEQTSVRALVDAAATITGPIACRWIGPRPGDVRHSVASLELAETLLGYKPVVSLRTGMQRTWIGMRTSSEKVIARGIRPAVSSPLMVTHG